MNLTKRRYLLIFNLSVVVLCASFAAGAAAKMIEAQAPWPSARWEPGPQPASAAASVARDPSNILARNIFCSTCPPLDSVAAAVSAIPAGGAAAAPSALDLKLLATLVSDDRAWCFAELRPGSGGIGPGLFSIGAKLTALGQPGVVITDIRPDRVLLLNGGREEFLLLKAAPGQGAGPVKAPVALAAARGNPALAAVASQIKKVGEGRYEIQRAGLNRLLGNPTLMARSARIVPAVKDGRSTGFSLYSIRQGSLFSLLGMFNGDTVQAVNGHAIKTPDQALAVYTKLRSASHLSIAFTRQGKALSHEYTIR